MHMRVGLKTGMRHDSPDTTGSEMKSGSGNGNGSEDESGNAEAIWNETRHDYE